MAGDWLKIEANLPEKPEVWQIAGTLDIDPDVVVAKLFKVWRWFDQHTEDGTAVGVGFAVIDAVAGAVGFAEAMSQCGWLRQDGAKLSLPNFDAHNGKTAKARAETARRVAKHKANKGGEKVTRNVLPRPLVAAVKERDKSTCVYCGRVEGDYTPPETSRDALMCIDHVIPVSQGGSDDLGNLVCACSVCNMFKSDRTPAECGLRWPTDSTGNALGNKIRVTSALPREEKRREDIKSKSVGALRAPDPPAELADSPTPASESPPAKPGRQRVPVQAIVDGYNAVMTRLPKVRKMTRQRQRAIEQLWRDSPLAGDLELFQQYWEECESDPFLSGVGPYRNGHENWRPDFDYLTKPDVVTKTYERAMDSIERGGSQ